MQNLQRFDIIFPEGFLITFALQLLYNVKACRISFDATSLYHPILSMLDENERAVFIIGGKPGVAQTGSCPGTWCRSGVIAALTGMGRAVSRPGLAG